MSIVPYSLTAIDGIHMLCIPMSLHLRYLLSPIRRLHDLTIGLKEVKHLRVQHNPYDDDTLDRDSNTLCFAGEKPANPNVTDRFTKLGRTQSYHTITMEGYDDISRPISV